MINVLNQISAQDMLIEWAVSEAKECGIAPEAAARRSTGQLIVNERTEFAHRIAFHRAPVLAYFVGKSVECYSAEISVDDLRRVHVLTCFQPIVTVAEFAAKRTEVGVSGFDEKRMTERPILIGVNLNGPWALWDGIHRCIEIVRGHWSRPAVPVIACVCESASAWEWWQ